jgi:3'(2'), 5'-bisphosphate nucleotidase
MSIDSMDAANLADPIAKLAEAGGEAILEVYGSDDSGVREKADSSPVTEADLRAEAVILAGLAELTPDIPVVAEESVAAGKVPESLGNAFWLVDPLDGTKEFISRNGEFTVNIALVGAGGAPVLGVVHTPALGTTHVGVVGSGAELRGAEGSRALRVQPVGEAGFRVLVSRSHLDPDTEAWLADVPVADRVQAGSSLKFCRVAEAVADLYPRFGRTMHWDTAAGHAVLSAAGGEVCTKTGQPLRYGAPGFANPPFVAYGATPPPQLQATS